MANKNQPVRACVLKVDVKCCSGCQNKATTRLQRLPGVSAAEYNAEKGLMTVTGDVEPMTLVQKLTRWGRKTELVSVNYKLDDLISDEDDDDDDDTSSDYSNSVPDPRPMERETQVNMTTMKKKKKEGILRKFLLFGCSRSKSKVVQPFPLAKRMFGSSKFGNGSDHGGYGNPLANATTLPRQPPPPPHMMTPHGPMTPQEQQLQYQMMMQQRPPQYQMTGDGSDHGGYGNPLANATTLPQRPPPPPHMMTPRGPMTPQEQQLQYQMMMQQRPPQYQMTGGPMPTIQQSSPPQNPPYFMRTDPQYRAAMMFPQPVKTDPQMTVNNSIHYSGK